MNKTKFTNEFLTDAQLRAEIGNLSPTEEEIRVVISGNLQRRTG